MYFKSLFWSLIFVSLFWTGISFGDNRIFEISGTYRLRYEFLNNYNTVDLKAKSQESYLLSRLRLEIESKISKKFKIYLQLQDSEIVDSPVSDKNYRGKNNPYHDPLDINELYIEYWINHNFGFRVGRQNLLFGDRRIFGPGDWGNTGRYRWDAVRLISRNKILESNFILGRYILHDPHIWPDKTYSGVTAFAIYNKFLNFPLEVFYVYKADTSGKVKGEKKVGNSYIHFAGLRLVGEKKPWNYDVIFVKEFGDYAGDTADAYGLVFILGYTFLDLPWKPQLSVQYVVDSGDNNPKDGKHETFDAIFSGADTTLYGGWMSLFFWRNIREHRIDLVLHPSSAFTLRTEYHYFTLDKEKDAWYSPGGIWRRDKTGSSGKSLGHEVNFILEKKFKHLEILAGHSFFIPEEFVKKTTSKSSVLSNCFLQLLFSF